MIWDYCCKIIFGQKVFVFEVLKAWFFDRFKPFIIILYRMKKFSPPQSFFLNFSCFSFVKFFLIVGDFDAAS